jgi:hypothetical protein
MPLNTKELKIEEIIGWNYNITCVIGKTYSLFLYFDGSHYQVKCVFPDVEYEAKNYMPLNPYTHIFPDGRLCLDPTTQGSPSIEYAYAKSILWATGFSVFEMTGVFPFTQI